ncbi:uncharacterized protein G6M90_00g009190 [Metarhizium brunneum]|uniref:Uncharacterized protein n=1 Tax=Metarhizium brunneum TaxID=500148 RepID=A0A7D5Z1P9_9HYPO
MATCILHPASCAHGPSPGFGSLPPELSELIWRFCLPADEAEVCCPMWPVHLDAEYEGLQGSPGASLPQPSRPFVAGRHGVPSLDARVLQVALVCARLAQELREILLVCGWRMLGPTIHGDTTGDDWAVPSEVVPLPLALRQCREEARDECASRRTFAECQRDGTWREKRFI